jgi:hypothetical protein
MRVQKMQNSIRARGKGSIAPQRISPNRSLKATLRRDFQTACSLRLE